MPNRRNSASFFFLFLFLTFFTYALFQTNVGRTISSSIELVFQPLQRGVYTAYADVAGKKPSRLEQLEQENKRLTILLAKKKEEEREMQALRDQFAHTIVSSRSLLPVRIVGMKAFLPGFAIPEEIVIDKGEKEGIRVGQAVISNDVLLGRIKTTSSHASVVELVSKRGVSLTIKTSKTNAIGVSKGQGQGAIILDNVVLSERLEKGDAVVTKGSVNGDGIGIPPGLVIGTIISIAKNPSALFQVAEVQMMLDPTRLHTVFVVQ